MKTKFPHGASAHPHYTSQIDAELPQVIYGLRKEGIDPTTSAKKLSREQAERVADAFEEMVDNSDNEYVRWFDKEVARLDQKELAKRGLAKRIDIEIKEGRIPKRLINRFQKTYMPSQTRTKAMARFMKGASATTAGVAGVSIMLNHFTGADEQLQKNAIMHYRMYLHNRDVRHNRDGARSLAIRFVNDVNALSGGSLFDSVQVALIDAMAP